MVSDDLQYMCLGVLIGVWNVRYERGSRRIIWDLLFLVYNNFYMG